MKQRSRSNDRLWMRTLLRYNAVFWILFGLAPPGIAAIDEPAPERPATFALLFVLWLCFGIVSTSPDNPVLRPRAYLCVLIVGMGVLSGVGNGGAALFIVTLPHFWLYAGGLRSAIAFSGAGAAATVAGRVAWQGWGEEFFSGNVVFTLVGYSGGVLLGLWLHRFIEQSDERARRLNAELENTQRRLAEAHQRQGAADERERLAREIHDTLAQGFASIIVLAEAARSSLDTDPDKSAQQLHSIENTARDNFAEARVLVGAAPQSGVASGSVARALRRTLDRFAVDTGLTVGAELPDVACDQPTRIALLRCLQESLANVRKHAGASTVGVVLAQQPYGIALEITDDGRGFVVEDSRGFGLDGMRRRLAELGGELTVTSAVGDGTRVLARAPTDGQVTA